MAFFGLFFSSFSANAQAPWCTPLTTFDCQFGDQIHNFSTTNGATNITNNASGCSPGGYAYVAGQVVTVFPGGSFDFSVQTDPSTFLNQGFAIYVDWNNDNDFTDPGEDVWNSGVAGSNAFTGTITAPTIGTAFGTLRMRVRCNWNAVPTDPCANQSYGEVEDYDLFLLTPSLTVAVPPIPDLSCFGDSNGVAFAASFGGTAPYNYTWSTGDTTDTVTGLPAGTYSVIVTDSAGDMDTTTFTIGQAPQIMTTTTSSGMLACFGDSTGSGTISATGGTPFSGYVIDTTAANFSPDTGSGTQVTLGDDQVTGALPLGFSFVFFDSTYTDIHIGSNGFLTFENVGGSGCCAGQNLPDPTTQNNLIAFAWDDLFPPGGGSVDYYTAGTAPFRRWVMNFTAIPTCCGSSPNVTTQVILYETTNCIEIHNTDINGVSPATQGIENQDGTEAYVYPGRNSTAWSANNDFISFCPSTPITFTWSTGTPGPADSGLFAGTYTITATDANGCEVLDSVIITEAPPLVAVPTSQDVTCFGDNDGYVAINITGGLPPYSIMWNNGSTSDSLGGLGADTLWAVLSDSAGCTNLSDTFIIHEPELLEVNITTFTDVTCVGGSDGAIDAQISGGTAPVNITWTPGGQTTSGISGIGAGQHTITVVDDNGCTDSDDVTLVELNPLPTTDLGNDTIICNDNPLTLVADPGLLYSWNLNVADNNQFYIIDGNTNTVGTPFDVIVFLTDINGCEGSDTINITIADCLGFEELDNQIDVSYYPNPSNGLVNMTVNGMANKEMNLIITNIHGQVIHSEVFNSGADNFVKQLNLTEQAQGVYFIRLESDQERSIHQIIIE